MILLTPPTPSHFRLAIGSTDELIASLLAQPGTRQIATQSAREAARFETFGSGLIIISRKGVVHLQGNRRSARLALASFIAQVEVA